MKWPELITAMDRKALQTMAQMEEAKVFELRLSRGECREAVVALALRPWLPKRYGLGSGEVVGADGTRSEALDVVIFDDLYSVVFKSIGGKILCPAESVFGTIEVKTTLNRKELDEGISKGQSVARISREETDAYQFTPTAGFQLGPMLAGDSRTRHHYTTGIVAIDAMKARRIVEELNRRRTEGERHLPDIVVCLSKKWIITKVKRTGNGRLTTGDTEWGYDGYVIVDTEDRTITVMNLMLQAKLQNINLPRSQAEHILTEALAGKKARVV